MVVFSFHKLVIALVLLTLISAFSPLVTALYGSVGEELMKEGEGHFANNNYRKAIRSWRIVVKDHRKELGKNQQVALFKDLSVAYEAIGNNKNALKCLAYAAKLDPHNEEVRKEKDRIENIISIKANFRENQSGGSGMNGRSKDWVEPKFVYGQPAKSSLEPQLIKLSNAIKLEENETGSGYEIFAYLKPRFEKAISESKDLADAYHGVGACLFYLNEDDHNARAYLKRSNSLDAKYIEIHESILKILNANIKANEPPEPARPAYVAPRTTRRAPIVVNPTKPAMDGTTGASSKSHR